MIVDVHNHVNPKQWIEPLLQGAESKTIYENGIPMVTYRPIHYQIDERVEGMDRAGVDVTLLYRPGSWEKSLEDCQVVNNYMGRVGLINSGGSSGKNDLADACKTAVLNKRGGGMGLISGRKAFQRPMEEGVKLLNTIQDVYRCEDVTIA